MLCIIIPAFNEAKRIGKVIDAARRQSKNVIVVDDGSSDGTSAVAEREGVIVLRHIVNMGKGAAAKTGCDYALERDATMIVLMDSDGQHDARDIPRFLRAIKGHDIVFGQRLFNAKMPLVFNIGNRLLDFMTFFLFGIELQDTQCGFRAFTAAAYRKIRWKAADYSMESEMIANAGRHRLRYATVKIATVYADHYKGTTVLDGISIAFNMLFWRLRRGIV
ncbi:MAG: glycosyltransferase family 2 protein [Nanoarchaeota archaeon]